MTPYRFDYVEDITGCAVRHESMSSYGGRLYYGATYCSKRYRITAPALVQNVPWEDVTCQGCLDWLPCVIIERLMALEVEEP